MFTRQHIKKKRCNECKRRKKKCELSGESCLYCLQKGIKCLFPDEVLNFDPQNGKLNKKETYAQRIVKLDHKCKHHNLIIQPKIQRQLHFPNQNKFFFMGYLNPKLFVPLYDTIIKNNEIPMVNDDKISIRVFNKDMAIDDKFALSSYALSSIRIKYIEDNTNFETDRIIIERLANSTLKDGLSEFFRRNNITISQNSNINVDENISMTKTDVKSIDDINLKVDFENLKNILMIEEPAITTDSNNKKFINLPYFITGDMANSLFNYFCNICTKEFSSSSNLKISMLTVTLPLILGNLSILKVVLLCSYFHKLQNGDNDVELIKILPQMKQLHLDILVELDRRLEYYSSISCDHSIFFVFILLTIEIINGGKGKLWNKLQNLAQSMISLRGGVKELCQSLTGECMMKLLVSILCTEVDPEYISFGIDDLKYICEFNENHEFFDNLVNMNSLTLQDFKIVMQMYFQVSVLISLINPSLGLDKKMKGNNDELPKLVGYELISEANMERIMYETSILEMNIKCFDVNKTPDPTFLNSQIEFAKESCLLYIYQLIYKQSSLSPNTLLLIKSLKSIVENILLKLKGMTESELRQTSILILPIFCFGVDLVGDQNRTKFINDLNEIYNISRKKMIKSAIDLLKIIWAHNYDGLCFVDWKEFSKRQHINISLCC